MNLLNYIKDKASVLLLNMFGIFFLSLFLKLIGVGGAEVILIILVWFAVLVIWFALDYRNRRRIFATIFTQLKELDHPYLIAEVMESSYQLEDRLYREILRISNRSVIEKIHELEHAGKEYKEYIESWVHEVKLPLTAAKLLCENETSGQSRELMMQLDRIEKQVEQVLFYARMENTYKDYRIHAINLREVVANAVMSNKNYFIQKGMQVELELPEEEPVVVSADEKWVAFLLDQLFSNAIKYCKEEGPKLRIYRVKGNNQISLVLEDNGIGIQKEDIPRIFDKGFTGKNGRMGKASTGIGLYLCKNLCEKLGMGISCESKEGAYTRIFLTFPDSNLTKM